MEPRSDSHSVTMCFASNYLMSGPSKQQCSVVTCELLPEAG